MFQVTLMIDNEKERKLDKTKDTLRHKYCKDCVMKSTFLQLDVKLKYLKIEKIV